jgi:hypothetical protein
MDTLLEPRWKVMTLKNGEQIEVFNVSVKDDFYDLCVAASLKDQWLHKKKPGHYNNGLGNTYDDPRKVERMGFLGEMGWALVTKLKVNFDYIDGGDKYDFLPKNLGLDVKTALSNYGAGLIRIITEDGIKLELTSDIYLFAFLEEENIEARCATISYVGWLESDTIKCRKIVPARKKDARHKNYDIPYEQLRPIRDLYEKIYS